MFVLEQAAQRHPGPVGDHFGDAAGADVEGQQGLVALGVGQSSLQLFADIRPRWFGLARIEQLS
ncbi:hypothetical protein PS685_05179 [Pseudomonas fluorescens]|uniref:Uncharacterized protein n=1 Tax=Pseudomonas fluorescens TaxID=294 RepID=A0A5E7AFC5_PSEFL|nr:hypothetical protein PS685_05179 [Pseudomonas fluorescens]